MKKSVSRALACLLAVLLLFTQLTVGAFAVPPGRSSAGQAAAEELYELGLFKGVGILTNGRPDFALDRTALRIEAVVMLVRLLGAEDAALAGHYQHPFIDSETWADSYIGYAFTNGITYGVSNKEFGTNREIDLAQFLTLILRALGYSDVNWQNPYPTADAAGLYYPTGGGFYRADIALICLDALDCRINGQDMTLRTKLINSGAIDAKRGSRPSGVYVPGPAAPLVTELTLSSKDTFVEKLTQATLGHAETITVHVPNGQAADYIQMLEKAFHDLSYPFFEGSGYNASYYPSEITIKPKYSDAARAMAWLEGRTASLSSQDTAMLSAARAAHDALVTPGMSDYARVRAFHDYLVNNTEYRETGERSHSAAGPLLDGLSVCEGYANAFDMLCYLSGIECVCINGTANGGGHSWNKVKLDGQWYNIDVTWDDPVSSQPILRYDYFLVSDSVLAQDHDWIAYSFWPAAPADYVVDEEQPDESFVPGPVAPLITEFTAANPDDFIARLMEAAFGHAGEIYAYVPDGQAENYVKYMSSAIHSLSHPFSEGNGYSYTYYNSYNLIICRPDYSDAARIMAWLEGRSDSLSPEDTQLYNAARSIHDALVTPGMSEYDQVKAFHDYIASNTEYRGNSDRTDRSHSAAGSLVDGFAVCEGYSYALDLLCYFSGIECICINGEATVSSGDTVGHAWNKVKIDGQWYNIDVTWDDPGSTEPILFYDYFLVSDSALSRNHDWIAYSFWPVAPVSFAR